MAPRETGPVAQVELPKDRCPNCGGPLRFPEHWKEGICGACGIFVEILPSTPNSSKAEVEEVTDVATRREIAKLYLATEELFADEEDKGPSEARGESGTAATGPASEPNPTAPSLEAPPEPQAAKATESELSGKVPLEGTGSVGQPSPPPALQLKAESEPSPPQKPADEPPIETPPHVPAPTLEPPKPEVVEEESAPEPPAVDQGEALVEPEIAPVPEWKELDEPPEFEPGPPPPETPLVVVDRQEAAPTANVIPASRASSARRTMPKPRLGDRILIHVGGVLVAFGGAVLMLGSLLHDIFRVPLYGHAYDAFGPLNLSAIMFGGLFLLAGLAAIGISLRGGVVRNPRNVGA